MRWLLILGCLVLPEITRSQVVEIRGGSSTLFATNGGSGVLYLPNSTTELGVGSENGHFHFGASTLFEWEGSLVTVGDRIFSFSAGGAGLSVPVRGFSVVRKMEKQQLIVFAGAVGRSYFAPFLSATAANHFGVGVSYERQFSLKLKFSSTEIIAGSKHTALQALDYRGSKLTLAGSAGLLENAKVLNGRMYFQPVPRASLSAAHQDYGFGKQHIAVNDAAFSLLAGPFDLRGSAFASTGVTGQTVGVGVRFGIMELRSDYFRSKFGEQLNTQVAERFGRHWTFRQFINESKGGYSVNYGGAYSGNRASLSLDYQTLFFPLSSSRSPFQQVLSVQLSFRLPHSTAVTIQTNVDPQRRVRYSTYGNSYLYPNGGESKQAPRSFGKYVIHIQIEDEKGEPVEGAAVKIGKEEDFSDSKGEIVRRVNKTEELPLRVLLENFSLGTWVVVSAPNSVHTDTEIVHIVVRRKKQQDY